MVSQVSLFGFQTMTVPEARQHIRDNRVDGISCPCCDQLCKVYKRKLNAGMAAALCWLVRASGPDRAWIHVPTAAPKWVQTSRELPKNRYWGLIESKMVPDGDTVRRASGVWRPTIKGVGFARSRLLVSRKVHLYNNEVVGFSNELTTITGALGDKWSYAELMGTGALVSP